MHTATATSPENLKDTTHNRCRQLRQAVINSRKNRALRSNSKYMVVIGSSSQLCYAQLLWCEQHFRVLFGVKPYSRSMTCLMERQLWPHLSVSRSKAAPASSLQENSYVEPSLDFLEPSRKCVGGRPRVLLNPFTCASHPSDFNDQRTTT